MKKILHFLMIYLLCAFLLPFPVADAYFDGVRKFDGETRMNGIEFKKYRNFPKEWQLVTVRFRHDSSEMRFTYANKIAFQHLTSGKTTPYPKGSLFGKVSFVTAKDPRFSSSEVPAGSKRYQFMLKDPELYKKTDGWGYALFDSAGVTFNENPVEKTMACHACHTIVKQADFVFSEPMNFNAAKKIAPMDSSSPIRWFPLARKKLPPQAQQLSETANTEIDQLDPNLIAKFFSGTLDEIIPTLLAHVQNKQRGAIYVGNSDNFSLVVPSTKAQCQSIRVFFKGSLVRNEEFCPVKTSN